GIEQHIAPDSFLGADRPPLVISGGIFFGPHWEARTLSTPRVLDADSRIDGDVLRFFRPLEQSAHRVEKVARLRWCCCAAVAALRYRGRCDVADRLMTRLLDHPPEMVLTIAAGRTWVSR